MKKIACLIIINFCLLLPQRVNSQVDEAELGAWYMYFFNATFKESSWGIQGDIQYRNWNIIGDLEQLLLRSGITFKPKNEDIKFTLGYGNINTGAYGSDQTTITEHRIYQEALFPVQFGKRFFTDHRFRYEQRFIGNQELRTRYRYNIFLNVPLNNPLMIENTLYLALYNELFINGQRNTVNGYEVGIFDRNRFYFAMGYAFIEGLKIQMGLMNQTTEQWSKNQLQLSIHHNL